VWYGLVEPMAVSAANVGVMVEALKLQTGASKIDIVSHSYGGPTSRYYLKKLLGTGNVDEWVSLGGPNTAYKGLPCWAEVPFLGNQPTALALVPGNACFDLNPNMPTMQYLNGGDQTPGSVRYLTIRSAGDETVDPAWTPLTGATNLVAPNSNLSHNGLLSDRDVYNMVKAFLD
jgi:triacylglycerol lipase